MIVKEGGNIFIPETVQTRFKPRYVLAKLILFVWLLTPVSISVGGFGAGVWAQEGEDLSYFGREEMDFVLGDQNQPWNYPRITIMPAYSITSGDLVQYIPYEFGYVIALDHGLHHLFEPVYRRKSPLLPGFRLEFSYSLLGPDDIRGMATTLGPMWLIPIDKKQKLKVVIAALAGMDFMRGQLDSYSFSNDAGYATGLFGFEFQFSSVFISLQGRFNYILDKNITWMSYGAGLGIGYQFSTKAYDAPGQNQGS